MSVIMRAIVIAVRIHDDSETTEQIFTAEHGTSNHSVLCVPESEAIAEQIFALASDFKANDHLPVAIPTRYLVPDRSRHALFVGCKTHICLCEHYTSRVVPIRHSETRS